MSLHPPKLYCKKLVMIENYLSRWNNVSAYAAVSMLSRLGNGGDTITWERREKSPDAIGRSTRFMNIYARDVGIFSFTGGPPGEKRLYHQGTLLILLVDRLLYSEAISRC